MKKEYIFLGLVVVLLSIIAFFLGANYGKNSPISGNVVLDNNSLNSSDISDSNNDLKRLNGDNKNEIPEIIGGGYVYGHRDNYPEIGSKCWSYGEATCIESTKVSPKQVELNCPKGYKLITTGFYTINPLSSEDFEVLFLCVNENLSYTNNSLTLWDIKDKQTTEPISQISP